MLLTTPSTRVILAPMEGVIDHLVRELLTEINHYDLCITEFMRVVDTLLPKKAFYRLCPELYSGGYTPSGTPVRIQLLGQSPEWLAENAVRAIELGSHGIDLNCGCPAKKVVGSDGGASLLKNPELIYQATNAICQALGAQSVVSVKIRLGWDSKEHALEIADAVQLAGASALTVHGRTKEDGYRADKIDWPAIAHIRQRLTIPVIANGEIWTQHDALRCRTLTNCHTLMVGRGALTLPNLGNIIQYRELPLPWTNVLSLLRRYSTMTSMNDSGYYHLARIKQWLNYLRKAYPEAEQLFSTIRSINNKLQLINTLAPATYTTINRQT